MRKINLKMIGLVMLVVAIVFILYALTHPEASFPWSNTITYKIYGIYVLIMVLLFIASKKK